MSGITCRIPAGARIAVTGRSGSGKTTLLHLLAGLDVPTSGTVSWPALTHMPRRRARAVGVVFQGPSLMAALDVAENVALPLLVQGITADEARKRAVIALDRLGIAELAAKLPDDISEGQAQRAAVARVLAARPALILADEPTGRLDHDTAAQMLTVLLDTAETIGATVVLTTHDPAVAERFANRWTMRDGQLDTGPGDWSR
ncbi:ABC transporter ATP-binding protein [Nocardia nepalensis]|uniref:ABC transporter ATP-binding protein n=1 Tax=Nocardia nepalensis TaxID=3375448 RepID=UPI003B67FF83